MANVAGLNDPNQTVICIPYAGRDDEQEEALLSESLYSPHQSRDLPDGFELRMEVYRAAWQDCLDRVQSIIEALNAPKIQQLAEEVLSASSPSQAVANLPYPEIPTFCLHGPPAYFEDVTREIVDTPNVAGCHLHPSDCSNITAAMKSLVSNFVNSSDTQANSKKRPAASLASYDINTLRAWYNHFDEGTYTQLMVIFHQFEQFDSAVLNDLFYICSLTLPELPFVFILSLSSPPTPSYLHAIYPRDTLALLRVKKTVAPHGWPLAKRILEDTFFSLDFEPNIMIGAPTLEYIVDYFTRYNESIDAILTVLQLTYMKHFDEPLTVLARDSLLGTDSLAEAEQKLSEPASFPFLDSLLTRMSFPSPQPDLSSQPEIRDDWSVMTVASLLTSVDTLRESFQARLRDIKVGYRLLDVVIGVLGEMGHAVGKKGKTDVERNDVEFMCRVIRGRCAKDSKNVGAVVKELSLTEAKELLSSMHKFFQDLPSHLKRKEEKARVKIVSWNSQLQRGKEGREFVALLETIGDWVTTYLDERLKGLEECRLRDIWYTGSSPFPSELINPAPRATIMSALLHPHEYIRSASGNGETSQHQQTPKLWELPDTSILFRRYLEGGKMINVYDWYESFAVVLESQRNEMRRKRQKGRQGDGGDPSTPSPSKNKGKGKAREVDDEVVSEDEGEDGVEWRMQVQARFIRGLHELDYMGFIKHTGRKADHVLKTVFDVLD
ncbi:hypothetical protein NEOLEDRAFT_1175977 [Neolentinus lepideus HHB14362 ss-1]|uniref:Uncharacterized protein n=1 Tax=Neolentinus lepideus HHB14362 ss-1 TaxID=1314782 RepID=A0A165UIP2_9AGAM|nr:hypothetical protein NEOLEDRAFT_1175977 [Neolentinus lepideus HHB14362 ss-1]